MNKKIARQTFSTRVLPETIANFRLLKAKGEFPTFGAFIEAMIDTYVEIYCAEKVITKEEFAKEAISLYEETSRPRSEETSNKSMSIVKAMEQKANQKAENKKPFDILDDPQNYTDEELWKMTLEGKI